MMTGNGDRKVQTAVLEGDTGTVTRNKPTSESPLRVSHKWRNTVLTWKKSGKRRFAALPHN